MFHLQFSAIPAAQSAKAELAAERLYRRLKGKRRRAMIAVLALGFLPAFAITPRAFAAVGTIAGSFAVTPTGQASYTIPLPAPGGAGGLAPRLSIVYASGSGLGLLGWDATIGGLSVIGRCTPTQPYDGASGPLTLTEADRFCLDGKELTTGFEYGSDDANYLTTPTAHLLATSHTSNLAAGPDWFTVKHPDGSVWEYGHAFNSRVDAVNASGATVHRLWALDKVTDASGNAITFHYVQPGDTGAYYLTEVDWGGNANAGTGPDHSFVFTYATVGAAATVYRYLAGNEVVWNRRLSKVRLDYNDATVLTWTPSYLAAGAGSERSRLAALSECDASGDCLPATNFQWQQGTPGFDAGENTGQGAGAGGFVADLNGDGREDFVYKRGSQWRVRFGRAAGGFGGEHATGISASDHWVQPIHYRPGAADQILYVNANNRWAIDRWTGSGFSAASTGIAAAGQGVAADVNGDGYDDLVTYGTNTVYVRLNRARTQSPGFGSRQSAYTAVPGYIVVGFRAATGARGPRHRLDFQAGGEGVIVRVEHHKRAPCANPPCVPIQWIYSWYDQALVWKNGAFEPYSGYFAGNSNGAAGGEVVPLDVNGDGLTDLVISGTATLLLNTGKGLDRLTYGSSTGGLKLGKSVAVDYSGNGRDDLLVPGTNGHWMRLASTGTGFAAPVDTGIASGAFGAQPVVADTEGRLLADLVGVNGAGKIELALRQGPYPDLLTKISDGLGNYDSLSWVPLSDSGTVHATLAQGKIFELARRGRYLLASVTRNDGIGGSYAQSYAYDTPLIRAGVGFSGIRRVTRTDGRDGKTLTHDSTFGQFENGLVASTTLAQGNGHKIRSDEYGYEDLEEGQPLLFDSPKTTYYDQQGHTLYTVTRTYSYDLKGIPSDIKVSTKDVASGDTWVHDTAFYTVEDQNDWCFGLHSRATVTDTLPDGTSKTRKTTFTPDYDHCREAGWTTNSNLATALQTQTTLTYGGFGNVKTVKVAGHKANGSAMAPRITTYGYDPRGEFRTSATDPAGDVTGATWNAALGMKTSETAPNDTATASYAYDGFGRPTKITLPSGAYLKTARSACSGASCAHWAYRLAHTRYTASGAVAGQLRDYYDSLGRLYFSLQRVGNGAHPWAERVHKYNALGELIRLSAPYFSGSGDTVHWTHYSYDPLGRVKKVVAPAAGGATATTTYAYDGFTTTVTDPAGHVTHKTVNPLGQAVSIRNALGYTSSYQYGPLGKVTQITGPDNVAQSVTYNAAGYRTSLNAPDLGGTLGFQTDSLGEVTRKTDAAGHKTQYSYDTLGRMTSESFVGASGQNAHWYYRTSGNGAGQLWKATKNNGFSRTLGFNALGEPTKVTQTFGGSTLALHYGFDSLGRIASITYPVTVDSAVPMADAGPALTGAIGTVFNLDGSGSSDPEGRPLTYRWSVASGPSASPGLTDADQAVAHFQSMTAGQWRLKLTVSDGGASASDTTLVTVNPSAPPPAPSGLVASTPESPAGDYSLSWDSSPGADEYQLWEIQYWPNSYPPIRTLPEQVYGGGATHFSFHDHPAGNFIYYATACANTACSGRSNEVTVSVGSGTQPPCNPGGPGCPPPCPEPPCIHPSLAAATAPMRVAYHYDANGNLASVTNANTGTVYWQTDPNAQVPAVNAWGTPQAWTLGNGIHVQRNRDPGTGAVTNIMAGAGENGAALVSLAYGYSPLGNTTSAFDVVTGVGYQPNTLTYNVLNMLRQFPVYNDAGYHNRYANYRPAGNISWRTGVGTYAYSGAEPHAVTRTTLNGTATHYSYNGVGEMISGGDLSQIQWTRGGRVKKLVGGETTSLAYGASGALIQKTVAGTASRYFGKLLVKTGDSYRARIVANGEVIAIVNINAVGYPTTDYLVHDAQGSPASLLDASGSLIYRYAWNAWGELVNPQTGIGPDPNAIAKETALTLGYTGHEELWQAGLVHTWARLYNPHLGRWLSPDPTVPTPYNPQSFNRYSYVLNNPLTYTDPLGLWNCNGSSDPGAPSDPCVSTAPILWFTGAGATWAGGGFFGPGRSKWQGPIICLKSVGNCGKKKPDKHNPCGNNSSKTKSFFDKIHVFGSVESKIGFIASVGLSDTVTSKGISGDANFGWGEGVSAGLNGGIAYNEPSANGWSFTITGGFLLGGILQFGNGSNGFWIRLGGGFDAGEFANYAPAEYDKQLAYIPFDQNCATAN